MKVALCLFGKLGNKITKSSVDLPSDNIAPSICAPYQMKSLSEANDIDIFLHSWSKEFENEIISTYKPKSFKIEKFTLNKDIEESISLVLQKRKLFLKVKDFFKKKLSFNYKKKYKDDFNKSLNAHCRWISTYKSVELMNNYSKVHSLKYDFVLVSRFDTLFFNSFKFKNLDQTSLYASHWNDVTWEKPMEPKYNFKNNNQGIGTLDLWYLGSQQVISSFAEIANLQHLYESSPHTSSYQHIKNSKINLKYLFYRGLDYEIARRALYEAKE